MPSITAWTRLEPCSRNPNMSKGLQACVHDPLWLLARQWQFGEFQAEDAGTPVSARIRGEISKLDRFYAGVTNSGVVQGQPYNRELPLEMIVEKEPTAAEVHPGRAAEASLHFFRLLKNKGLSQYRQAYLDQYSLAEVGDGYEDADSERYLRIIKGRSFNTHDFYEDLKNNPEMVNGVRFVEVEGLEFEEKIIRKTAIKGWNNGGAVSANYLAPGEDGWVEASTSTPGLSVFFGLSEMSPDHKYQSIDYAAYFYRSTIYIFEKGEVKLQVITSGLTPADVIRIERQGTTIQYLHNGRLVYTSEMPSQSKLYVDLSFIFQGAELANLKFSKAVHIPPALLNTIEDGDRDDLIAVTSDWLKWYEERYGDPTPDSEAWLPERMEHAFAVSTSSPDSQEVYVANEYHGGHLDWYHFNQNKTLQIDSPTSEASTPESYVRTVIPSPVSFRGMPESRWWTFEDAEVNLGNLDAGKEDLGRMLLLQYALSYSDDWFLMPLEIEIGSTLNIESLVVTDTFGVRTLIKPFDRVDRHTGAWQLFTYAIDDTSTSSGNHLFLPPTLATSLHGQALEEVHLLRDEMANMAWAVEYKVENARGEALNRHETELLKLAESSEEESTPPDEAELIYRLMTNVPAHWIPLVPRLHQYSKSEPQIMRLQRGKMVTAQDDGIEYNSPMGELLSSNDSLIIENEEVEKAGAHLTRAYQFTRWLSGQSYLWIARNKRIGRGEGWSGLRYDSVDLIPGRVFDTSPIEPTLLSISPEAVYQRETVEMTITGTGLSDVNEVIFLGSGLSSDRVTVVDDTQVTFELTIDKEAALGPRLFQVRTANDVLESLKFDLQIEVLAFIPQPVELPIYLPTGIWNMNGNGYEGELNIVSVDSQGKISGTVYGHPIQGFWSEDSEKVTFTRNTDPNNPSRMQIYTGYLFKTPPNPLTGEDITYTLTGFFEAFAGTGAVAERTLYGWVASIVVEGL